MGSITVDNYAGLWIPAYDGNPDVGLLTSESTKDGYDDFGGSLQLNGGTHNISGVKIPGFLQIYNGAVVTLTDCLFEDRIDVQDTSDTTINDCLWKLTTSADFGLYTQSDWDGKLEINDCEVIAAGTPTESHLPFNIFGTVGDQIYVRRCRFDGWEDGPNSGGYVTFEQCHVAGTLENEPTSHEDGIVVSGSRSVVRYCHINSQTQNNTEASTGALSIDADFGAIDDVTIHNNFLDWGQILLTLEPKQYTLTGVVVTDNIFGDNYSALINSEPEPDVVIDVWTGNVDTVGDPISEPT
jgi:hypothetical protein